MQKAMPAGQSQAPKPAPLRARLLGQASISVGERIIAVRDWPRRSARSLLLLLLVTPGHSLHRERIIDLLWPEASLELGQNALRVALHGVRRTLEPALQTRQASSYILSEGEALTLGSLPGVWVDVDEFERAVADSSKVPEAGRPDALRSALSLYTGHLLEYESAHDWSLQRAEHLRRLWRKSVLQLAQYDAAQGSLGAISYLHQLIDADALDESAHRGVMRLLLAAGQPDEAMRQFTRCREFLRFELDVEPSDETLALAAEIRGAMTSGRLATIPRLEVCLENLPAAPNPLIGRARELESIEDLLLDPGVRLVTLTGPGGIGKTRLALEAARQAAGEIEDGVCFVDLSALADHTLVLPTIVRSLGLDEIADSSPVHVLGRAIADRHLLLVLDNLEQVIEASADIGGLLAACANLTILATSRQPLDLRAEHIVPTSPLAVPVANRRDASPITAARLLDRYDAVTLFVQRAQATRPGFKLTDANAATVAAICSRLDGLPLALELAAARTRHLAPQELLAELENHLPELAGGRGDLPARQRTLRDAIGWSYDLLTAGEQRGFRSLAVFAGSFSSEAARGIIGEPAAPRPTVDENLWALADKSLIQQFDEGSESTRYRLLETIREFGLEKLVDLGEEASVRRQHAAWFLSLAEEAVDHLGGQDQVRWLERLEEEHDNFRAALEWSLESRDTDTALGMGGALADFWRMKGYLGEGRSWLERSLALADDEPSHARALCSRGAGMLAQAQGDSDEAIVGLNSALKDWQVLGDERRIAQTKGLLADIARGRGEYERSVNLNEEALAIFDQIGFKPGIADTLNQLGIIASDLGQYQRAHHLFERSSSYFEQLSDRHGMARVFNNRGSLSFWQEDYTEAVSLYERSLALWRELGHRPHTALVLANLGEALRADGDLEQAMSITREGLELSREVGDKRSEATALFILGSLMQHEGYDPRALPHLGRGLHLYALVGDRLGMAWCLEALAGQATAANRPGVGATFLGAADALRQEVGVSLKPAEQSAYRRHLDATRRALGASDEFDSAWESGRSLSTDALLALAEELERDAD